MDTPAAAPAPAPASAGSLKNDVGAGFLVFLIALPLCLGISMASGFPPIAGVLTAIIGGVGVSLVGGARLTIKGPAAGLIVIALGAVTELQMGDADPLAGYRRALAVGVVAAGLQILFALCKAGTLGVAMSPSVVHGMLAAIGVIIMSKQLHTLVGVKPKGQEPLHLLMELPESFAHANPHIALIGILALVILFGMPFLKFKWLKKVPAQMVVLAMAIPMGLWLGLGKDHSYTFMNHVYEAGPRFLVNLAGSGGGSFSLSNAIVTPDFSHVFSGVSIKYVVMFSLVGAIESTLSVLAVDSMDPERRASDLNRDLLGVGLGNLAASLVGGLPMISEIVRSKANVDAGARSRWANFSHGAFLLLFVSAAPFLLQKIPLAALAGMLVYTGTRLASPNEFRHAYHLGKDQLFLFLTTLVLTLAVDLLVGVAAGLLLKIILHHFRGASLRAMFKTKVVREDAGEEMRVAIQGAASFASLLKVRRHLKDVSENIKVVKVDLREASMVDHTFLLRLDAMAMEWPNAKLEIVGLDTMKAAAHHPHAVRTRG